MISAETSTATRSAAPSASPSTGSASPSRAEPLAPGWYPRRTFRALRALVANPDDTRHVFTIIESLSGHAPLRVLARFRASESGRRLLETRAQILPILRDRTKLEAMPKGSLAHAYLAFLDREKITADGLVQASVDGETGVFTRGGDFEYVGDRLRDTHDLWHAVSGYHGDVRGETALLAFSVAQTKNPGVALIVAAGLLKAHDLELFGLVRRAFVNGRQAEWLPAVEWELLLPLPVEEVRRRLRVELAPKYEPVRTSDLRATGQLAMA
jgi:ubiquinone biosynthesis protein COQ4